MSQELFYTSAPKGLIAGSRGFCTVATTRGLSPALIEKLESLSGYRHLFPPLDAKAPLNPVLFSHLLVPSAGKVYHVLSRICASGLDYSERTNKFAHHVVLEPDELPAGGPAWLMMQPGFMEREWNGQVEILPTGRPVPSGDSPPRACQAWQQLTGDAGWGGVLAESVLAVGDQPAYVIFEPGTETLPLLAESLALLPPERRWDATFSSYFTGLPAGISSIWRCVVKGSPEAMNGRQLASGLSIDLSKRSASPDSGLLVDSARTGRASFASMALESDSLTGAPSSETVHNIEIRRHLSRSSDVDAAENEARSPRHAFVMAREIASMAPPVSTPPPIPASKKGGFEGPPRTGRRQWLVALAIGLIVGIVSTLAVATCVCYLTGYALVKQQLHSPPSLSTVTESSRGNADIDKNPGVQTERQVDSAAGRDEGKAREKPVTSFPGPKHAPPASSERAKPRSADAAASHAPDNAAQKDESEKKQSRKVLAYVPMPEPGPARSFPIEQLAFWKDSKQPYGLRLHSEGSTKLADGRVVELSMPESHENTLDVNYTIHPLASDPLQNPTTSGLVTFAVLQDALVVSWRITGSNAEAVTKAHNLVRRAVLELRSADKKVGYLALRSPPKQLAWDLALGTEYTLQWDAQSPRPTQLYIDSPVLEVAGKVVAWKHGTRKQNASSITVDCEDTTIRQSQRPKPGEKEKYISSRTLLKSVGFGIEHIKNDSDKISLTIVTQDKSEDVFGQAPMGQIPYPITLRSLAIFTIVDGIRVDLFLMGARKTNGAQEPNAPTHAILGPPI